MNKIAALAALAVLAMPASAHAAKVASAKSQIKPESAQAAVRYALPHLLSGVRATCASRLSANGYLATNGAALQQRFAQGADSAWPAARQALLEMGAKEKADMAGMFAQMPDSALKPFVDAMITTMVGTELKADDCPDIERGLQLLAPLPPENIAGLAGFIFEMVDRGDKNGAKGG
ncbi:hypothetical protein [Parafrankia sp. BMG5.11]|uniref:hypothetical protein n=1 Tax=Parafrankia sp. BMG5.11 TaxID=222540 RepID=UPI00103CED6A|nr:hypothetical protein [Parafrankia sp. BMG5.11]TCJ39230.1 hypothetical protein E0504_08775 [Parafrankia sp. BMG5.11]